MSHIRTMFQHLVDRLEVHTFLLRIIGWGISCLVVIEKQLKSPDH